MSDEDEMLVYECLTIQSNLFRNKTISDGFKDYHRRNKAASSNDGMAMAIIAIHLIYEKYPIDELEKYGWFRKK